MDIPNNSTGEPSHHSGSMLAWLVSEMCAYITFLCDMTYLSYIDLHYLQWLMWLFYPIISMIVLPIVIGLGLYASSLFMLIYRLRRNIKDAYSLDFWEGARKTVSAFWDAHGRIWHGNVLPFIVGYSDIFVKSVYILRIIKCSFNYG